MPAVETSIWMALRARAQSLVLSPALPVVWPKEDAPPSGKYLLVAHLPNRTQRRAVTSSGAYVRPGILQLTIRSPLTPNQAPEVDIEVAARIAAHFPADLPMDFAGIRVRVTKTADIAQSFRDNVHWTTPISVFYEAFH